MGFKDLAKWVSPPLVATIVIILVLAVAVVMHRRWPTRASTEQSAPTSVLPGQETGSTSRDSTTPAQSRAAPASTYREIDWQALLPKGWDPMAPFKGLRLDQMQDGDPQAQIALYKARKYWKTAPTEPSLDGMRVRLPGFVVSLDGEGETIREFLLVPYFGACIHVPPPPANQVVHVHTSRPIPGLRTMDTVWISGVMRLERAETMMGDAGYGMQDARVERYSQ